MSSVEAYTNAANAALDRAAVDKRGSAYDRSSLTDTETIRVLSKNMKGLTKEVRSQLDKTISLAAKARKMPAGKKLRVQVPEVDPNGIPMTTTNDKGERTFRLISVELTKSDVKDVIGLLKRNISELALVHDGDLNAYRQKKMRTTTAQTSSRLREPTDGGAQGADVAGFFDEASSTANPNASPNLVQLRQGGYLSELLSENDPVTSKDILTSLITIYAADRQLWRLASVNQQALQQGGKADKSWIGADDLIRKYFSADLEDAQAAATKKFQEENKNEGDLMPKAQQDIRKLQEERQRLATDSTKDAKVALIDAKIQKIQNNPSNRYRIPTADMMKYILLNAIVSNSITDVVTDEQGADILVPGVLPSKDGSPSELDPDYKNLLKAYETEVTRQKRAQKQQKEKEAKDAYQTAKAAWEAGGKVGPKPVKGKIVYELQFGPIAQQAFGAVPPPPVKAGAFQAALQKRVELDTKAQQINQIRISQGISSS